ncbi:MAG: hypothetical protein GXO77_15575 [Calditrichaeota bacterium]|nr:hypothetical protein [Calditrichota bacterium]
MESRPKKTYKPKLYVLDLKFIYFGIGCLPVNKTGVALALSLIDRLAHCGIIIRIKGDSYRMKAE